MLMNFHYKQKCRILPILFILSILKQVAPTTEQQQTSSSPPPPINADSRWTYDSQNETLVNEIKSKQCKDLDPNLVQCDFNYSCNYGDMNTVDCQVTEEIPCAGKHSFQKTFECLYCWQLPEEFYSCAQNTSCKLNSRYLTPCNVNSTTYCLGRREFNRFKLCKNFNGHKWSTALTLSVLFGGFGIDRFYLGHWQEGVGKLFSFGGFGVWTLIDAILISIGYLKPGDSNYE